MKNKKNILIVLLFLSLIAIMSINTATAKTISINDASSYNQTGLSLSKQIQKIIDTATAGDTIKFLGSFYEDLTLTINKKLNIISNSGTIISGSDSSSLKTIFFINGSSASGTTISGFNLDNEDGNGITLNNTKNIKASKNNITAKDSGVSVSKSSNITINNNNITKSDEGISLKDSNNIYVENNKLDNNNEGISLDSTNNVDIKSNNITNNKNGISLKSTKKTNIINNKVYNNKKSGIYSYKTQYTQIKYNNIKNNEETGILAEGILTNLNLTHNNISYNHYGIRLDSIDNSYVTMKTNSIRYNVEGISFGPNYIDNKAKDISSNDISSNTGKDVELRDSSYYDTLEIGPNWYGANADYLANICPKLKSGMIQFKLKSGGNGVYMGVFTYNGQTMTDLPPIDVLFIVNGEKIWVTTVNGVATVNFGKNFDKNQAGGILNAIAGVERFQLGITYTENINNNNNGKTPVNGGTGNPGNGGLGGLGIGGNGLGTIGIGTGSPGGSNPSSNQLSEGASSSSGSSSAAQSSTQQAKVINIDDGENLFKIEDSQALGILIIGLLLGSIIVGYMLRRDKKTSF
ncbi:hypothetical protein MARBORIA2_14350 [Methanobrevibacter arboriphilus]|jgi:parallel beta-helix repeat protein|uniref:Uncharacterized protein n=1 Tax=Methanobrevibacter arboriphilus TaxID=39441 RepID=A0ACA8R1Z8_METAZ|nr:right-handed parallel beta-helix repeat-containing protein [Methanobrevibacter arboriphilus]MCC7562404.1 right-handed parallel beta-helix repeat-containing protein [Methanobrevibacter arboriphilus]BBL61566.1 hypothetical protein MarbSA_06060 [Methanobrevibacter arboriphilus]GLI12345.1 hypothetical protein MARBORIA2_14350 [Methanobrevibacter arboriphilus]